MSEERSECVPTPDGRTDGRSVLFLLKLTKVKFATNRKEEKDILGCLQANNVYELGEGRVIR